MDVPDNPDIIPKRVYIYTGDKDWPGVPVKSEGPPAQWPGTPSQGAAGAAPPWPGTPAPNQQVQERWPGTPAQAAPPAPPPDPQGLAAVGLAPRGAPTETQPRGILERIREGASQGFGEENMGPSDESIAKAPILGNPLVRSTLAAGDAVLRAPGAAIGAASGLIAGGAEKAGMNTAKADRLQRDAGIIGQGALIEGGKGKPGETAPEAPNVAPKEAGLSAARNASQFLEKIFSPETVDAPAKAAAGIIRELYGQAARHTAITEQAIESGWKTVNAMPAADRLSFIDYVEGRSGQYAGQHLSPELQDLADTMRTGFEQRMAKLRALPAHSQASFVEDYFPHFWKDPRQAAAAGANHVQGIPQPGQGSVRGGAGKQGSGASLKQRSVPTIADGLAAGLEPVTDHPLEATMRYVTSMDHFIASEAVLQTAKDQGYIKYIKPKVMGASGHPDSFKVPEGWVALEGRGATNGAGAKAYAPEGFATVYNNFISQGFHGIGEEYGNAYDAARHVTNSITGLELSVSGYHFLTMAKAALDNSLANAIRHLRGGKPIEAAKQLIKTPLAPFSYAWSGKQVKDVYLGLSPGTRELQQTVESLTRAGGRAKGKSPDYEFSSRGSYWTALKRGALKLQWTADRAEARGANIRSFGEARFAAKQIGRIMDTVAAPLFESYTPSVKNGAFRENLATWLQHNPNATQAEIDHAARQLWDTIDDRFGEMVQDNMFMNKFGKQLGMLLLRSWSWAVGQDARMLGGATRDFARAPFKAVTGTGPNDTRWTQKMDMAIAMPLVYGTASAIYQYLKTGESPRDLQDLKAPRTGGVDASTGQPERLIIPGPEKDVFGFTEHPLTEALGKMGTGPRQLGQLAMNEDYRGDPIYPEGGQDTPPAILEIAKYLGSDLFPIMVKQLYQGRKTGSKLNVVESALGVHPAPRYLTDPEGYEKMMESIHGRAWKNKERHDRKQKQLYGGDE